MRGSTPVSAAFTGDTNTAPPFLDTSCTSQTISDTFLADSIPRSIPCRTIQSIPKNFLDTSSTAQTISDTLLTPTPKDDVACSSGYAASGSVPQTMPGSAVQYDSIPQPSWEVAAEYFEEAVRKEPMILERFFKPLEFCFKPFHFGFKPLHCVFKPLDLDFNPLYFGFKPLDLGFIQSWVSKLGSRIDTSALRDIKQLSREQEICIALFVSASFAIGGWCLAARAMNIAATPIDDEDTGTGGFLSASGAFLSAFSTPSDHTAAPKTAYSQAVPQIHEYILNAAGFPLSIKKWQNNLEMMQNMLEDVLIRRVELVGFNTHGPETFGRETFGRLRIHFSPQTNKSSARGVSGWGAPMEAQPQEEVLKRDFILKCNPGIQGDHWTPLPLLQNDPLYREAKFYQWRASLVSGGPSFVDGTSFTTTNNSSNITATDVVPGDSYSTLLDLVLPKTHVSVTDEKTGAVVLLQEDFRNVVVSEIFCDFVRNVTVPVGDTFENLVGKIRQSCHGQCDGNDSNHRQGTEADGDSIQKSHHSTTHDTSVCPTYYSSRTIQGEIEKKLLKSGMKARLERMFPKVFGYSNSSTVPITYDKPTHSSGRLSSYSESLSRKRSAVLIAEDHEAFEAVRTDCFPRTGVASAADNWTNSIRIPSDQISESISKTPISSSVNSPTMQLRDNSLRLKNDSVQEKESPCSSSTKETFSKETSSSSSTNGNISIKNSKVETSSQGNATADSRRDFASRVSYQSIDFGKDFANRDSVDFTYSMQTCRSYVDPMQTTSQFVNAHNGKEDPLSGSYESVDSPSGKVGSPSRVSTHPISPSVTSPSRAVKSPSRSVKSPTLDKKQHPISSSKKSELYPFDLRKMDLCAPAKNNPRKFSPSKRSSPSKSPLKMSPTKPEVAKPACSPPVGLDVSEKVELFEGLIVQHSKKKSPSMITRSRRGLAADAKSSISLWNRTNSLSLWKRTGRASSTSRRSGVSEMMGFGIGKNITKESTVPGSLSKTSSKISTVYGDDVQAKSSFGLPQGTTGGRTSAFESQRNNSHKYGFADGVFGDNFNGDMLLGSSSTSLPSRVDDFFTECDIEGHLDDVKRDLENEITALKNRTDIPTQLKIPLIEKIRRDIIPLEMGHTFELLTLLLGVVRSLAIIHGTLGISDTPTASNASEACKIQKRNENLSISLTTLETSFLRYQTGNYVESGNASMNSDATILPSSRIPTVILHHFDTYEHHPPAAVLAVFLTKHLSPKERKTFETILLPFYYDTLYKSYVSVGRASGVRGSSGGVAEGHCSAEDGKDITASSRGDPDSSRGSEDADSPTSTTSTNPENFEEISTYTWEVFISDYINTGSELLIQRGIAKHKVAAFIHDNGVEWKLNGEDRT